MPDIRKQITNLRDRIDGSDDISEEDQKLLLEFSDELDLLKSKYTDHRHNKLLRHCTIMAEEEGQLSEALEDTDAAKDLVRWINLNYDNEYTNHDYRTALRVFGERVTEGEGYPPSIEWVPSGTSSSHDPVPDPADMLEWEVDVLPMVDAARNARDAALITVAFDAGPRADELRSLSVGDVSDTDHGLRIWVDGKTGQRSVDLIPSVPYLKRWLSDHPAPDDSTAPLWSKLNSPEGISYRQFLNCFKDAAERAGITKSVTPTNFRKSNATYLARKGMNQAFIEDRQGRKRGSDATAHYVARFGTDSEAEYARLHGLEVEEEEPEPIGPVECPRCSKETPRHESSCVWCNQVLEYDAIDSIEDAQRDIRDVVLKFARDDPEILTDFQRNRELMDLFESDPDLYEEAQEFVESLPDE